jgi:hypothetical protein
VIRATIFIVLSTLGFAMTTAAQQNAAPVRTVVQMSYYALPGKERDVLENRLRAADVLVKNGITRGRVMTRIDNPRVTAMETADVVWEGEFADTATLQRYEEVAEKNPDFLAARRVMGTLTRKVERRYFQVR